MYIPEFWVGFVSGVVAVIAFSIGYTMWRNRH